MFKQLKYLNTALSALENKQTKKCRFLRSCNSIVDAWKLEII